MLERADRRFGPRCSDNERSLNSHPLRPIEGTSIILDFARFELRQVGRPGRSALQAMKWSARAAAQRIRPHRSRSRILR